MNRSYIYACALLIGIGILFGCVALQPFRGDSARGSNEISIVRDDCVLPAVADRARIVAFHTYEGAAISSVALDGQNETTNAARIHIEPGRQPLYIIAASHDGIIWQLEGSVDRVATIVLPTYGSGAGATGIPAGKIALLPPGKCGFYQGSSFNIGTLRTEIGRDPDDIFYSYETSEVFLPGGRTLTGRENSDRTLGLTITNDDALSASYRSVDPVTSGSVFVVRPPASAAGRPLEPLSQKGRVDLGLWEEMLDSDPAGIAVIDPGSVISANAVQSYDILPGDAGLVQLVRDGRIEKWNNTTFRIGEDIPRFPAQTKPYLRFLLAPGIGLPPGAPRSACVFSEETREAVSGRDGCRWRERDSRPPQPPSAHGMNSWYGSKLGFVFRSAYFTDEQISDPDWETARMRLNNRIKICTGEYEFIRREVSWYRTVDGGRCGAIVYMALCDAPK